MTVTILPPHVQSVAMLACLTLLRPRPWRTAGFGVDDSTHYGCTALWMAAYYAPPHALRCIDILLSKGADLNATSRELTTPLAMAAMRGA